MKPRWTIHPPATEHCHTLALELGISPLTAQCLINRGFRNPGQAAQFLDPRLKLLEDPFRLPNVDCAVERLLQALDHEQNLVIFGDYDVDGVTATALLETTLKSLGWRVRHYLPRRHEEGYGLTRGALESCLCGDPPDLLIAVDCGSTSNELIDWLRTQNVDVIVVDHHQLTSPPPDAYALVNPQLDTSSAPHGRELCSVGIAFKLLHALVKRGREMGLRRFSALDLKESLDLVALGTVADLVPLTGENRILVHAGLKRIESTSLPGLVALKEVAQTRSPIGTYEVGFQLAPRLNAAGRLETAEAALELLVAPNEEIARPLALALDATNRERQDIERRMSDTALARVRERFNPDNDWAVVEASSDWHLGVVGIVAARISREVYRPTFILGPDGDGWRGSGRSIAGFDLAEALRACDHLLVRHGGHAMAAGVSLKSDQLEAFRFHLNQVARERMNPSVLVPELRLDAVAPLHELTVERVTELARLAPFGSQNPPIQLCVPGVHLARPPQRLGRELQHWKLWLTTGGPAVETLWWGSGHEPAPHGVFDVAVAPAIDTYGGRTSVKFKLLDWRPSSSTNGSHG